MRVGSRSIGVAGTGAAGATGGTATGTGGRFAGAAADALARPATCRGLAGTRADFGGVAGDGGVATGCSVGAPMAAAGSAAGLAVPPASDWGDSVAGAEGPGTE